MTKKQILIVDDDPMVIYSMTHILKKGNKDYSFLQARDGAIGFTIAQAHQPDIILTDWEMPNVSGIEFLAMLKQNTATADIPVVMITGKMNTAENFQHAFETGAIDFINKPINPTELTSRIGSILLLAELHKQQLEQKHKDLTLASAIILQKKSTIKKLVSRVEVLSGKYKNNPQLADQINQLISDINTDVQEAMWDNFKEYFEQVDVGFLTRISQRFPKLSQQDIKICSLLRLNLSSKEIASALVVAPDSIRVSRVRLRKKLNLTTDINLVNFLMNI